MTRLDREVWMEFERACHSSSITLTENIILLLLLEAIDRKGGVSSLNRSFGSNTQTEQK